MKQNIYLTYSNSINSAYALASIKNGNTTLFFSEVKTIYSHTFNHKFISGTCTGSVTFPNLTTVYAATNNIGAGALAAAFSGCTGITGVYFPALNRINNWGLYEAFKYCPNISVISFPALTIAYEGALADAFISCGIKEVNFPVLTTISRITFGDTFSRCKNLTVARFPKLTTMLSSSDCFARCFYDCPNLSEIHFLASMSTNTTFYSNVMGCGKSDAVVWDL